MYCYFDFVICKTIIFTMKLLHALAFLLFYVCRSSECIYTHIVVVYMYTYIYAYMFHIYIYIYICFYIYLYIAIHLYFFLRRQWHAENAHNFDRLAKDMSGYEYY